MTKSKQSKSKRSLLYEGDCVPTKTKVRVLEPSVILFLILRNQILRFIFLFSFLHAQSEELNNSFQGKSEVEVFKVA